MNIIINQAQTCSSAAPNSAYVSRQKATAQHGDPIKVVNWFPLTAEKRFSRSIVSPVSRCPVEDSWRVQLSAMRSIPSCWESEKNSRRNFES